MVSYIYIISDNLGNYKVGITNNDPNERLLQLQTGNAAKLTLEKTFKVPQSMCYKLEKQAHEQLSYKFVKRGEWFKSKILFPVENIVFEICEKYILD